LAPFWCQFWRSVLGLNFGNLTDKRTGSAVFYICYGTASFEKAHVVLLNVTLCVFLCSPFRSGVLCSFPLRSAAFLCVRRCLWQPVPVHRRPSLSVAARRQPSPSVPVRGSPSPSAVRGSQSPSIAVRPQLRRPTIWAPTCAPFGLHPGLFLATLGERFRHSFWLNSGSHLGSIWGTIWAPFWVTFGSLFGTRMGVGMCVGI